MKKILITLLIIFLSIIAIFKIRDIIIKKIYVTDYSEYVYKYSKINEVDPLLVFAVIKVESDFNPQAISRSNACGLMQLMENTAIEVSEALGDEISKDKLFIPETNIKLGTTYLASLLKRYDGNINLTLAAYNAGIGNVEEWIQEGIIKQNGSDIENIPFKETNNYVRKILRDYGIYKEMMM